MGGGSVCSIDQRALSWCRSSACASGECVEVAYREGRILVRNSGVPGTVLEVTRFGWQALLTDIVTDPNSLSFGNPARSRSGR